MSTTLVPAPTAALAAEPLTPHDLVTYFRCPHELELAEACRHAPRGTPIEALSVRTPREVVPLHRSPLDALPPGVPTFNDGRFDVFPADRLVYEDEGEEDELPILFAPEQTRPDPVFRQHGFNLVDPELGLSGRPDLIVLRSGAFIPIEYKSTHPFRDLHAVHGRGFDLVQLFVECRLIEAVTGRRPPYGVLLYGDRGGDGAHEGWFQVPYTSAEAAWVTRAVATVRADRVRAPVPSERTCSSCPPHRDGLCRFAAARFAGPELSRDRFHRGG